mgnify:CR=1 FL=1
MRAIWRARVRVAGGVFGMSYVSGVAWGALEARYDLYHVVDAFMTVNEFTLLSMLFNSMGVQPDAGATARFPADVPYQIEVPARERPLAAPRGPSKARRHRCGTGGCVAGLEDVAGQDSRFV